MSVNNIIYSKTVEKSPVGYAFHEIICDESGVPCDYRYLEINKAFENMTGMLSVDIIGKTVREVLPGIEKSTFDWIACYGEVALQGIEREFEQFSELLDKWYKVNAFSPETGYFVTQITDMSQEHRQIQDLKQISQTSESLLRQIGSKFDYQFITDTMLQISEAKLVMFNLYNVERTLHTTTALAGDRKILKKSMDILGFDLIGHKWQPDPLSIKKMSEKTVTRFASLYDFAGQYLPKTMCDSLAKILVLGDVIAVTVSKNERAMGDFTLMMPEGKPFEKDSFVEIIARQLGLAIEKRRAEEELLANEHMLNNVFQSVQDGMCVLSPDLTIKKANQTMEQLFSHAIPLAGKTCYEAYQNRSNPCDDCPAIKALATQQPAVKIVPFTSKGHKTSLLEVYAYPLTDHLTGKVDGAVEFIRDITERKGMEQQLVNEKERFRTTLLSVGDGVISTDEKGKVVIMNAVAEQLTGWTQIDAAGQPIEAVFHVIWEDSRKRCDNPVEKVLKTGQIVELGNHTLLISKDKAERPIADSAAPIFNGKGDITGVVLVFRDYSDKKKHQAEIEYLAYHDYLTGVYNRRYFEETFIRLNTKQNQPLAIILGDINGIKIVNDSLGHHVGDLLIKETSNQIEAQLSDESILARMGGDKFGIILVRSSAPAVLSLTNHLEETMNQNVNIGRHDIYLSVSFGCSIQKEDQFSLADLMIEAEDYVYQRKYYNERSNRSHLIKSIMGTLFQKSPREKMHSERVGKYSKAIAKAMNWDLEKINRISVSASLHDIGKIGISEAILNKTGSLTAEEWEQMKQHPLKSATILDETNEYKDITSIVAAHHERWDGTGYPKGLRREAIPIEARIIAVADAFDAMTHVRTYRKPLSREEAAAEIIKCAGTQFDPVIAELFVYQVLKHKQEKKPDSRN